VSHVDQILLEPLYLENVLAGVTLNDCAGLTLESSYQDAKNVSFFRVGECYSTEYGSFKAQETGILSYVPSKDCTGTSIPKTCSDATYFASTERFFNVAGTVNTLTYQNRYLTSDSECFLNRSQLGTILLNRCFPTAKGSGLFVLEGNELRLMTYSDKNCMNFVISTTQASSPLNSCSQMNNHTYSISVEESSNVDDVFVVVIDNSTANCDQTPLENRSVLSFSLFKDSTCSSGIFDSLHVTENGFTIYNSTSCLQGTSSDAGRCFPSSRLRDFEQLDANFTYLHLQASEFFSIPKSTHTNTPTSTSSKTVISLLLLMINSIF